MAKQCFRVAVSEHPLLSREDLEALRTFLHRLVRSTWFRRLVNCEKVQLVTERGDFEDPTMPAALNRLTSIDEVKSLSLIIRNRRQDVSITAIWNPGSPLDLNVASSNEILALGYASFIERALRRGQIDTAAPLHVGIRVRGWLRKVSSPVVPIFIGGCLVTAATALVSFLWGWW